VVNANREAMAVILKQQERLASQYKHTFAGQAGEEVLRDLARYTGADGEPFAAGQADQTAYNLGKRAVFIYIKKKLEEKRNNGSGE
jgi:hypothetical protein